MTTTRRDVQRALEALVDAADRRGIPHGRLVLEEGSPTYGRAWRLFEMRGDGTGLYEPFDGRLCNFLGWSKAEAEATLRHYRAGLCLVGSVIHDTKGEQHEQDQVPRPAQR